MFDLESLLQSYKTSNSYRELIDAEMYYRTRNSKIEELQAKKLTTYSSTTETKIGERTVNLGGHTERVAVEHIDYPHRVAHPVYYKLVNERVDFILGNPYTLECENTTYLGMVENLLDVKFRLLFSEFIREGIKCGKSYLVPSYNGELKFHFIPTTQILVQEDKFIHFHSVKKYDSMRGEHTQDQCDVYDRVFKTHFVREDGGWRKMEELPLLQIGGVTYKLDKLPLVEFRANHDGLPLLGRCKSLLDDLDMSKSKAEESIAKLCDTLLVIKAGGGTDVADIVESVQNTGILKTRGSAEVDAIRMQLNTSDLMGHVEDTKRSIAEYLNSVSITSVYGQNLSGVALRLLFLGLSNECKSISGYIKVAMESLLWFVDLYLDILSKGKFYSETVDCKFTFNELLNESEMITDLLALLEAGVISKETILTRLSFVESLEKEEIPND